MIDSRTRRIAKNLKGGGDDQNPIRYKISPDLKEGKWIEVPDQRISREEGTEYAGVKGREGTLAERDAWKREKWVQRKGFADGKGPSNRPKYTAAARKNLGESIGRATRRYVI